MSGKRRTAPAPEIKTRRLEPGEEASHVRAPPKYEPSFEAIVRNDDPRIPFGVDVDVVYNTLTDSLTIGTTVQMIVLDESKRDLLRGALGPDWARLLDAKQVTYPTEIVRRTLIADDVEQLISERIMYGLRMTLSKPFESIFNELGRELKTIFQKHKSKGNLL